MLLVWEITSPFCIFLLHWIHAIPIPNVAVVKRGWHLWKRGHHWPHCPSRPQSRNHSWFGVWMWSNFTNFSRKGWPIFKAYKLLQFADNHQNSRKKTANKHHQQISIGCLLGSFIPKFAKMSAWLGPSHVYHFQGTTSDASKSLPASRYKLFFWVGKGQVNVRYCGHHNVSSCVIWHLVSPYFWENHGKSHQSLTFYSAICSLKKFRGREFLPFFAVFVTISQHPRPPVDLVLAFLPLDHGHIGIGTALGIFLKNRGICQKCHHVTRTIIQIETWNQVTNRDFFHSVKKWLWDA